MMSDPIFLQSKKHPLYLSYLIYLYILIFCAGVVAPVVAGVVAALVASCRAIMLVIIAINYRNHRCTGNGVFCSAIFYWSSASATATPLFAQPRY